MAKRRNFEINRYYHSYSRGVNRCDIFKTRQDYFAFQEMINKFNTTKKIRTDRKNTHKIKDRLVDIFCYTLMPNHFHFILKELTEGGISLFLQKVLGQYTLYYNKKYGRVGALFGSRFKDKLIDSDHYFEHLVEYIWNNPVKLINPKYSSKDILNGKTKLSKKEKKFALNYPYKKFPDSYRGPEDKKFTNKNFDIFDF